MPDEPATIAQESAVPETVARAATPEIQVAEEMEASLPQGATGGEAQTLELVCTSWAATSGLDANFEDDEEATTCHTLEHEMTWASWAFDELVLPATLVSFLVKDSFFYFMIFSSFTSYSGSVGCRRSNLQVGSVPTRCANSARSRPSWRCSLL
jgi:hypothetical protein